MSSCKINMTGIYKDYNYKIELKPGDYYCAYVENKNRSLDWLEENIIVHGGVTFYGSDFFGWNYAHNSDYFKFDKFENNGHKWTKEEVLEEVKNTIEQLIAMEEK